MYLQHLDKQEVFKHAFIPFFLTTFIVLYSTEDEVPKILADVQTDD